METYRTKLKLQSVILALALIVLTLIQVLAYAEVITPAAPNTGHWTDLWNGFIAGASLGISILFLIGLIKNIRALFSEKALKKLRIASEDERAKQIAVLGQSIGARAFLLAMLPATIASGYFNVTVCLTCLAVTLGLSLFMSFGKLYYCKKI